MNWPPRRDSKADVWSVTPVSSDEGLTFETSVFESLYGPPSYIINPVDKTKL